jgi:DnaJ-domain-containing protein 1
MSGLTEFDYATKRFDAEIAKVANWKHGYFGAAYSTRLRAAIADARAACDRLEVALNEDDEAGKKALAKLMSKSEEQ